MVRKRRPTNRVAIALAAMSCLTAAATTVVAETRRVPAPAMPLGAAAPAPEGFIALCRRDPDQCPAIGEAPDLEQMAAEANRRRWSALFGLTAQTAAAPAAGPVIGGSVLSDAPIVALLPRLVGPHAEPAQAPANPEPIQALAAADLGAPAIEAAGDPLSVEAVAATDFTTTAVAGSAVSVVDANPYTDESVRSEEVFALDRQGWRTVNGINRRLNRAIRHVEDRDLHGQDDLWILPADGLGDCEDYVLAKRAALIEAGVPTGALSIAIVETPRGETHAVLLLASVRGEYVLDSLSPWVTRWDRVDYRWRERQARGGAFDWVSVAL